MKTVVFCGPSLDRSTLERITRADIAAPIRRGDLETWREHDVFVILDGEFAQSLSVSPKEILRALDAGKTVIGAASMGALRAAELAAYGMIGIGWIYDRFVRASVRREDDVALTYSPVDFVPHTVPMVNVEYWLAGLYADGDVSRQERAIAARRARRIFYADRTEKRLLAALEETLGRTRLTALLQKTEGTIPDIKSIDAEQAVLFADRFARESDAPPFS
jgi:hypothetical protein